MENLHLGTVIKEALASLFDKYQVNDPPARAKKPRLPGKILTRYPGDQAKKRGFTLASADSSMA